MIYWRWEQKLKDAENQNLVEELGRVRSQLVFAQEQREKKGSELEAKILLGKEEIVSLGKQHDKAIEEKNIAEDELIVRSREIEKKLLTILGRWMNWSRRCRGSR